METMETKKKETSVISPTATRMLPTALDYCVVHENCVAYECYGVNEYCVAHEYCLAHRCDVAHVSALCMNAIVYSA